jgi:lipopolysaccharide transport system ATP-binding protein
MTMAVIQTDSLGKEYRRGLGGSSGLLRDTLARALRSPASLFRGERTEKFWALRDASLEVKEGEVLGLIGRNGSGKTTLLKILSRITRPTEGWAEIRGRVGSLLEVGTGFHPELTGRENTYLSGAILGMSKKEISRKFDEIVAFAELEKFIDTPVKHYSSGMYVRLAFAVAAHLEPEILLVDEVLAVGDARFQRKCLGRMGDVARAGRTVVLVSHQLNQIRRLCHRAVWVDAGTIRQSGPAAEVVNAYESAMSASDHSSLARAKGATQKARFVGWEIVEPRGESSHELNTLNPVVIRFVLEAHEPIQRGVHGVTLYNAERQIIWGRAADELDLAVGTHEFTYEFPMLPVKPGGYTWGVSLWDDDGLIDMDELVPDMIVSTESHQHPLDEWSGVLNMPCIFDIRIRPILQNLGET